VRTPTARVTCLNIMKGGGISKVDYSWTAKNCNVRDFLLLMGTVEVDVITVWNRGCSTRFWQAAVFGKRSGRRAEREAGGAAGGRRSSARRTRRKPALSSRIRAARGEIFSPK
jgi:hypothetical protein